MEQFNLNEYIANPSRKVLTRDGRPVRIICTDAKRRYSIVALVEFDDGKDYIFSFLPDGTMYDGIESLTDLFFETEKK